MVKIRNLFIFILCLSLSCVVPPKNFKILEPNFLYDQITFEIITTKDARQPDVEGLEYLVNRLQQYNICKTENVIFAPSKVAETTLICNVWNRPAIEFLVKYNRKIHDLDQNSRTIVICLIYVDGRYIGSRDSHNTAGLNFGNVITIFPEHLTTHLEGAVLLHEFGHFLQLCVSRKEEPSNPQRPRHCNNSRCVMYWSVSRSDADFDDNCSDEIYTMLKSMHESKMLANGL